MLDERGRTVPNLAQRYARQSADACSAHAIGDAKITNNSAAPIGRRIPFFILDPLFCTLHARQAAGALLIKASLRLAFGTSALLRTTSMLKSPGSVNCVDRAAHGGARKSRSERIGLQRLGAADGNGAAEILRRGERGRRSVQRVITAMLFIEFIEQIPAVEGACAWRPHVASPLRACPLDKSENRGEMTTSQT